MYKWRQKSDTLSGEEIVPQDDRPSGLMIASIAASAYE